MRWYCQRKIIKLYTAFVAVVTFIIALDLIQFSASPFVITFGKKNLVFGQLQINVNHMRNVDDTKKIVPALTKVTKVKNDRIYLFSAIITDIETNRMRDDNLTQTVTKITPTAIVTGWQLAKYSSPYFKCCFKLHNDKFVSILSSNKTHWLHAGGTKLQAKQFKCPINFDIKSINSITISSGKQSTCPKENKFYITPTIVQRKSHHANGKNRQIGVCVKLVYGSIDARRLIEWFEVHKLFGVGKVIAYTYKLNPNASKVLKFYEKSGKAELHDFDFPEKGVVTRDVGMKKMQSWNDEQVALFDCQERLRHFDYVAVVDTDEFIIPNTKRFEDSWKTFLDKKFRKITTSGLMFLARIHADTWGPTNKNHPLYIGRYSTCSLSMYDRIKGIYMPSRVQQGSVSTHEFRPLKGYNWTYVKPEEATLHHYRRCRKEWLRPCSVVVTKETRYLYKLKNTTKCFDLRRSPSRIIEKLANTVQDEVLFKVEEIGIGT